MSPTSDPAEEAGRRPPTALEPQPAATSAPTASGGSNQPATREEEGPATPAPPAGPVDSPHIPGYEVLAQLGKGGMGAVFRGRDPELGRELAIKVLLDKHQHRPDVVQRFLEEAQIGGQLQHPGIVPVYALGRFADGRPYFTMKLVKGLTLAALLAQRPGPAEDLPRFLKVFEQACQALAYAHSHGVIHRDLKPSNIMVGKFGEVQVMDWGLAKVLGRGEEPPPPSPEEMVSDIRTDIGNGERYPDGADLAVPFSNGCSHNKQLTGRRPRRLAPADHSGAVRSLRRSQSCRVPDSARA
jgi:serine/threonine protein kinase